MARLVAMIKVLLFLVMAFGSFSTYSEAKPKSLEIQQHIEDLKKINEQLLMSDSDLVINHVLEKRDETLKQILQVVKKVKTFHLPVVSASKQELTFLASRVRVNTERGNELAAQRDLTKLEGYKAGHKIRKYLVRLRRSSKSYETIDEIVAYSQKLLDQNLAIEKKLLLADELPENRISQQLKENYQQFLIVSNSYQDILTYVISNPREIASVHWFQEFSLLSAISMINHFEIVAPINHKLAPFKIDVGGVVLSIAIYLLVFFSYPFVFRCTSWCIETHVIEPGAERQELIYHEIRRPVRALLLFFGINLGAYAFFYKTDYRVSLEGFSFIVYSLLITWLLFRIIDSTVLVQAEKLSSANKELRKELINLGVQTVKGLVAIIILAFGLSHFGISLTAIMSTLGVGGLAFALAAKDTLSNLFGGMTILFDNIFRMGDWVKINDVEGTVAEIGLRSTTIRTFDNALITIPNSLVLVSSVKNWNRRAVGRRIKMHVGVTYECKAEDLKQGIVDIREMLKNHSDIANPNYKHGGKRKSFKFASQADTQGIKSTQLVFLDRYNDYSIDILIYCFSRTVNWDEWLAVKEDVLFKIAEILENNNLEFAYPTEVRINRPDNQDETNQVIDLK